MHSRINPEPIPEPEGESEALREQAERCRRLAKATYDRRTNDALKQIADGFERSANELEQKRKG